MVTLNDIAAKLGISKSTVSKGLNNASDVSEELRRKILETATELGYISRRSSKKLCILIENMGYQDPNQFGYDLIAGFQEMARPEGWTVDVAPLTEEYQRGTTYQQFMAQGGWRGAFVLGFSLLDPWMEEFRTAQIPTVLYDNCIKENPCMASVGCDSAGGLEAAVRHLHSLGHRRIGLLCGPLESYVLKERYRQAVEYMDWFKPAWMALSEDERYVLQTFYWNEDERQTDAVYDICDHFNIERSSAYNKKNRAVQHLALLLYGK